MNAEPKCVGARGNCLSKIISPHLHSLFMMVVIHIYYFPSLCTAWQYSTALVAGEGEAAKGNTKKLMSCTSRLPFTFHQAGTSPSFPSPGVGYFFFLLLRWIRPDFRVLISTRHWVSKSLWGIRSCWKVALERWRLEVVVWNHRSFLSETASWILKSGRARGLTQQGDNQGSMGTLCFPDRFWSHRQHVGLKSNSDVTTGLDALPWAFASGTERDLPVRLVVASANFWDECCELQNGQCPSVQSWERKVGRSSAKGGHSAVNVI